MSRSQHHRRLAWLTAGGLGIALVAVIVDVTLPPGETLWHMVAAPEEDGGWKFVEIDGVDVSDGGYSLGVRWGEISGFHDGCNSCGFEDLDQPRGALERSMICTLQACEEKPNDVLFARFAFGTPQMRVENDRLILTLPGHRAVLVRPPKR